MQEKITPFNVFLACFSVSSLAALSALLRSGKPLTWRNVISTMLYSGMFGLVIGLLWYNYFDGANNVFFLIGVSGLAGLGGNSLIEFIVGGIAHGFNVHLSTGQTESQEDKDA